MCRWDWEGPRNIPSIFWWKVNSPPPHPQVNAASLKCVFLYPSYLMVCYNLPWNNWESLSKSSPNSSHIQALAWATARAWPANDLHRPPEPYQPRRPSRTLSSVLQPPEPRVSTNEKHRQPCNYSSRQLPCQMRRRTWLTQTRCSQPQLGSS